MKEQNIHWHYKFNAYDKKEGTNLVGSVLVEVIDATSEVDALKKVKNQIKRKGYYLSQAYQCRECYQRQKSIDKQESVFDEIIKIMKQK